ncbi:hypothetical protein DYH10_03005 [Candidatus Saccharibacteria bacterium CPR2]|nr:hypothetical protein [Candidatus Saccharibacteria bacterium CPR2]
MKLLSRKSLAKEIAIKLNSSNSSERQEIIKMLAAYIVEEKLTDKLDVFINDIALELEKITGSIQASVKSRFPLSVSLKRQIKELIIKETGTKNVILHEEIDENLLGGVTVRSPELEIDISLNNALKSFRFSQLQDQINYEYQETGGIK